MPVVPGRAATIPLVGPIDLHAHTIHSDGTFTPTEAVRLAVERGLAALSISDHDNTGGIAEAIEAADGTGLEVVPGTEFSALHDGGGVHVLAYWPDLAHPEFQAELTRLREDRFTRGERMVARLRDLGYPVTFERVRAIARGESIGRPHVAQALVEAGVVPRIKDAFSKELIAGGGKAYVEKHAIGPVQAVELIHRAGGVAVLAHPALWRDSIPLPDEVIEAMADAGLDGLECAHPEHDPETEARYRDVAKRLGLVPTGSSDCHGDRYDPVRMGSRTTAPEDFEALKARAR